MNVNVLSDCVLLNNYLSGDRSAISELIQRHAQRVRNYIGMMVKDDDIADDIFQDTFIKAVKVIDEGRYTDNGKFLSWHRRGGRRYGSLWCSRRCGQRTWERSP